MIREDLMPRSVAALPRHRFDDDDYAPRERQPDRIDAPLDVVAERLRSMPYGPFTDFAKAIKADPETLWSWACART